MEEIIIYEEINYWLVSDVVKKLDSASGDITVRLHSYGGSVFEGNFLANRLRAYDRGKKICIIDGIAASIATVIAISCDEVHIVSNGFFMVHAPYFEYLSGNKNNISSSQKLLLGIENELKALYKTKSNLSEEEINALMDGADHWFTSQEALDAGFVNLIVDLGSKYKALSKADVLNGGRMIMNQFLQNKNTMKEEKRKAIEILNKLGKQIQVDTSTDEQLITSLANSLEETSKELEELKNQVKTEREQNIVSLVEKEIAEGVINVSLKNTYVEVGKANGIEALTAVIGENKKYTPINSLLNQGTNGAEDRRNWDFEKWQKEDPRGLEKLPQEKQEELYNNYIKR